MKNKNKIWLIGWLTIVLIPIIAISMFVYKVDPFFHYHSPYTNNYYYKLDNERSQNDGIIKHFDYDAIITGTSMTDGFNSSEFDTLFGVNSIKIPFAGGSYKEINDNLKKAFEYQNVKIIIRSLEPDMFFDLPSTMTYSLDQYPKYLYDSNPFNDVNYLLNKDVIFSRAYAMTSESRSTDFTPGITSFDEYSQWLNPSFGVNSIFPDGYEFSGSGDPVHLTDEEKNTIEKLITQNVTSITDEHPNTEFYYFIAPYSAIMYMWRVEDGTIYRQLEAEQYVIELILEHPNIKLFSFNCNADLVTDLNNYKDNCHYGNWINSYILKCMKEDQYRLTKDNYQEYLETEFSLYTNLDYAAFLNQTDYADDAYAAELWNEKYMN